jgi:glycosyltransferase involved in cell wall biosynthesis
MPGITDLDGLATRAPADAVLVNSQAVASAQGRRRPTREIHVVHPGIEDPRTAAECAQGPEIPAGRALLGVVGRLQALKRQHLAIEALAQLREGGRDVHLLVVGGAAHGIEPEYERSLRGDVAARGLEDRVTFTGQVPDASAHIAGMDVLLNTTTSEGLGMTLVEALALGTPAVAFDGPGGQTEVLEHGRCGLLARDGDASDLARQVGRVLDDPSLRDRLTAAGRQRYEDTFRADAMTEALEGTLERIAR